MGKTLLVTQVRAVDGAAVRRFSVDAQSRQPANDEPWICGRECAVDESCRTPGGYQRFDVATYYPELLRQLALIPARSPLRCRVCSQACFRSTTTSVSPADLRETDARSTADALGVRRRDFTQLFNTMRIGMIRGRDFSWHDDPRSTPVAVIDTSLASRMFPTQNAIGQRIRIGTDPNVPAILIIGIVEKASFGNIRSGPMPIVFRPILQEPKLARIPIVSVRMTGNRADVEDRRHVLCRDVCRRHA